MIKNKKNRPKKRRKRRNILFTRKDKRETGQQGNAYKTIYPNCDLWSDIGDVCLLRVFFALKPWMQQWFAGNAKTVMIPEDEQAAEDSEKNQEGKEDPALDAESYEEMTAGLNERVKEARKSIVSVSSVSEKADWDGEMTGILQSVTGVIAGDNGREFLIIADSSICTGASAWRVTISDGKSFDAALKKVDNNRKIAVFGIGKHVVDEDDSGLIKVAVLGNSKKVAQGDAVIALGNIFGYADGMSYGVVSASNYKATFFDGECAVIATDIPAEKQGTGMLFNMDGEVVGMISSSVWNDTGKNVVNAYGISDLKPIIELLINGKSVPYIGIYGTTVTEQLAEEHKMPSGIYVADVDPDSPAMAAGIQIGDIICEASGEEIKDIAAYQNIVIGSSVGETMEFVGKRLGSDGYVNIKFSVVTTEKEEVK